MEQGEIILYQPDETIKLEVRLENETVWLSIEEMSNLFGRDISVIGKHIRNIFKEEELVKDSVWAKFAYTASDGKTYQVDYYNLDVIISVGYRVKSKRGTQFRQWANKVLKEYLLKGYSINQRLNDIEHRIDDRFSRIEKTLAEHSEQIDFFVRTSLPPVEGIFFDGQIFDAYKFATDIIKSARKSLLLIEYPPINIRTYRNSHDRFLIVDDKEVYHIGASMKDLGKKCLHSPYWTFRLKLLLIYYKTT